jgi:hypothetical protein
MTVKVEHQYDPETIKLMQSALEDAWHALSLRQQNQSTKVRLATIILEAVAAGERDPARLRTKAITRFVGL